MRRNKHLILGAVFVLAVLALVLVFEVSSAEEPTKSELEKTGFEDICSKDLDLATCVQQLYLLALGLGALVAFLMIVLAGYRYMTAAGNAQQVEGAKEALASALIGLIVIFVAFILLYIINPDLVRFKKFSFPPIKTPTPPEERRAGTTQAEEELFEDFALQANLLAPAISEEDGSIVMSTTEGSLFTMTPDPTSNIPGVLKQTLEVAGFNPSPLTIIDFRVANPASMPESLSSLLGGEKPNSVIVVRGSPVTVHNGDTLRADTTGKEIFATANLIAQNHFGVNLNPGGVPPGGAGHPPSGSCPPGQVWTGHLDTSQTPPVPICVPAGGGGGGIPPPTRGGTGGGTPPLDPTAPIPAKLAACQKFLFDNLTTTFENPPRQLWWMAYITSVRVDAQCIGQVFWSREAAGQGLFNIEYQKFVYVPDSSHQIWLTKMKAAGLDLSRIWVFPFQHLIKRYDDPVESFQGHQLFFNNCEVNVNFLGFDKAFDPVRLRSFKGCESAGPLSQMTLSQTPLTKTLPQPIPTFPPQFDQEEGVGCIGFDEFAAEWEACKNNEPGSRIEFPGGRVLCRYSDPARAALCGAPGSGGFCIPGSAPPGCQPPPPPL